MTISKKDKSIFGLWDAYLKSLVSYSSYELRLVGLLPRIWSQLPIKNQAMKTQKPEIGVSFFSLESPP
jgi:hypothetical protein